jgi:hypothetical protein
MAHKSTLSRKHARFHVVEHAEWATFLDRSGITASGLCQLLDISRERAVDMVKREPRPMERLAMLAIYHRLADPMPESASCTKSGRLMATSAAEPNARGRIGKESAHGLA